MPAPHHSGFYRISQCHKGKTSLDLNEASDDTVFGWQLDHMQTICTLLQTTTPTPHHSIFTGRMLFLTPNQQRQSTEGNKIVTVIVTHTHLTALCPGLPGSAGTGKVKTNLDFPEARDNEWQWHQVGRMQVCTPQTRRITTPAPHCSPLPAAQPTVSKH